MSSQLALKMVTRLPYSPENFVIHGGVRAAFEDACAIMQEPCYAMLWIEAAKRFGKTHFAVRLSLEASKRGLIPRLLEGKELIDWLDNREAHAPISSNEVFIIDDAQEYFSTVLPGNSGKFVGLVEDLRIKNAKIILLSSERLDSMPCDQHIMSRLRAAYHSQFLTPEESDLPKLVNALTRQRGLSLTEARLEFVAKRMRRDIEFLETYLDRVTHLSGVLNRSVTRPLLADAL